MVGARNCRRQPAARRNFERRRGERVKIVFPFPQRGEHVDHSTSGRPACGFGRSEHRGLGRAQERIGRALLADASRAAVGNPLALCLPRAPAAPAARRCPARPPREAQIRERVFVPAIDAGLRGSAASLTARHHLRRRALEQAPAAAGEQRVAAEQRPAAVAVADIGDVARVCPGNVEHATARAPPPAASNVSPSATACVRAGNRFVRGPDTRTPSTRGELLDAADVVRSGDA